MKIARMCFVVLLAVACSAGVTWWFTRLDNSSGWRTADSLPDTGPGVAVLRVTVIDDDSYTPVTNRPTPREDVERHAAIILAGSGTLLAESLQEPNSPIRGTAWFKQFNNNLDAAATALRKSLAVRTLPNAPLIHVRITGPSAEDAAILVNEICNQHINATREGRRAKLERKIDLFSRELKLVEIELAEDVLKQIHEKEQELGLDLVGTAISWNGTQSQLDRMMKEDVQINTTLAGVRSRYAVLVRDVEEGRTPAEIERELNNNPRLLKDRQRLDDLDIEIELLASRWGEQDEEVAALKLRREIYQDKLDEKIEELKSTCTETMKASLKNDIDATAADANRVQSIINTLSGRLGNLNRLMNEYHGYQEREKELRKKETTLKDEISRIRQFALQAPWNDVEFAARPAGLPR